MGASASEAQEASTLTPSVSPAPKNGAAPKSRAHSEVEPNLRRQRPWRDVVRPAERGEKVVECIFVGDVDRRELQTPLCTCRR